MRFSFASRLLPASILRSRCIKNLRACTGQATVEYLIVGVILVSIIVALGVFSGRLQEGLFVDHAADSASHAITTNTAGSAGDILLY